MAARHLVGGTFLAALRHLLAVLAARCVRCAAHNAPSVKKYVLRGYTRRRAGSALKRPNHCAECENKCAEGYT